MLAIVLLATMSGDTVAAARRTRAQAACCAAMAHDCGTMAFRSSCCAGAAQAVPEGVVATTAKTVVPQGVSARVPYAALASVASIRCSVSSQQLRRWPPGVPTYLLVSSLRI